MCSEMFKPELVLALATTRDAEVRRRLEAVRADIDRVETRPEQLRELRLLEVLEHIGNADARQVLQDLTRGAAAARFTQQAKAAPARLTK